MNFSLRKSVPVAAEPDTAKQAEPFPIQRTPAEMVVDGEVVAGLKVDVAVCDDGRARVGGWRVGELDILVESETGSATPFCHAFERIDVNEHFGLTPGMLAGFAFELAVPSGAQTLRLGWRFAGGEPGFAELTLMRGGDMAPRDVTLLGPLGTAPGEDGGHHGRDAINISQIARSGLLDEAWYRSSYPDVEAASADPATHYYFRGATEGRCPNYLFDTRWYCDRYPDVLASGMNPLLHYLQFGEREGRQPSVYFEPTFYRYQLDPSQSPSCLLADYLAGGWRRYSPNEYFHADYYLESNQDVRDADIDPLLHYTLTGWTESRDINRSYSFERYGELVAKRLGRQVEPLSYHLQVGRANGESLPRHGAPATVETSDGLTHQIKASLQPGSHFEERLIGRDGLAQQVRARLFAFYLPQFHPFPENDQWWGKGFTEWTNVTRAMPRFSGHHQPQLPRDLGYYDLRNIDSIRAQVDMARTSGVTGFCFYYYWFNGKRLLDKPLDLFVEHADVEFPFCLMWANENWTRRWDGMESDVLMSQEYRPADDEALIADFARYFADPRYERVDGRPLLIIYRPGLIPEARKRIASWRRVFRRKHGMDPLILMAQCFDDDDPRPFGLDGAIEFPPHKLAKHLTPVNSKLEIFDPGFKGHYLEYDDLVQSSRDVEPPAFDLIRTLVPAWDNEARKPGRGMGFANADPERYENWLRYLVGWAAEHPIQDEYRYVFVNAWNEWAEGAHLEPDLHNGVAYLNATLRGLIGMPKSRQPGKRMLLVGHDAHRHGAQLLTLNLMRTLHDKFGVEVTLVLLEGGPLVPDYRRYGKVFVVSETGLPLDLFLDVVAREAPDRVAICNTVVVGDIVKHLHERGFKVLSLVHELPRLITERSYEARARAIATHADEVLFAAEYVKTGFEEIVGPLNGKAAIQPQGIYQDVGLRPEHAGYLRSKLQLPYDARIMINLGYGDLRKGFDLFVEVARRVTATVERAHFVWLGEVHDDLRLWLDVDLESEALSGRFHVLPFTDDVAPYLNGADLMVMTSREDPFPSIVLEALACGLPVVAFDGGGGYAEAIARHACNGDLVPMANTEAMASAVRDWLKNDTDSLRDLRSQHAAQEYGWRAYVFGLLQRLYPDLKKVSVVLPNYNYAAYLPERIGSILAQDYPIYELIVLDDQSPDNSVAVIRDCLAAAGRDAAIVVNARNSGSVFRQWEKGARMAQGEYLWIAEADDASSTRFLSNVMAMCADGTTLGFTDSAQLDKDGNRIGDSYGFYYQDLPSNPMAGDFAMKGSDFVKDVLSIKNVILNVSSVVFDRKALLEVFERSGSEVRAYRMAGDWRLYSELLADESAKVVYSGTPDNLHRRHAVSVTHSLAAQRHLDEIRQVQGYIAGRMGLSELQSEHAMRYLDEVAAQLLDAVEDRQEEAH
ncbi:glycoside hydrolase family 99-like domain-containing protein [Lysobacter capsici]|uniref:glycoside hydrolase family 99-like domain-containing protein n=1 Tax=Lysobacter capsici TaxID=435897 RepID=UPI001C0021D7|nr:glycoside hydrolase family 99-like domain-containing protein [Lysobacter capsici]QWF15859.1 glycoside hydrolase family 99-like domain-containing protein [Lysobacter capsici]